MHKLKRNGYIQGAFVATFGIVFSKILGMIYVIPFYSIIGEQGGALYGYAYNIYSIFLGISTAGIPLAISKIISEYDTLGNQEAKEKTFKVAKRILSVIGIICFLIMMIFTDNIAYMIIGNIDGGNTYQDIAYVIRVISLSILIVPLLSVYRGYLQGHRIMTPTSISQVLEQIIRVSIIIGGSFLAKSLFHLSLKETVSIALFGATFGALISLIYLRIKVRFHRKELVCKDKVKKQNVDISSKAIAGQILIYAFPFIFSDVCKSLYNSVDTFFVVKTLVSSLGYTAMAAESIMSVISTWGNKLNMIVIAIGTGFMSSLIPNLTASIVKKDKKDIDDKINRTFKILIFITLPMAAGLSFLSVPVWNIFYGSSAYGPSVFAFSIFTAFVTVLLSTSTTILLTMREYKTLFISLGVGLVINAVCDVPAMFMFDALHLPAYYGATFSTILGNVTSVLIVISFLHNKYEINFKDTMVSFVKVVFSVCLMLLALEGLAFIIPLNVSSRILSCGVTIVYAAVGMLIYYVITHYLGLFQDILGDNIIKNRLKRR